MPLKREFNNIISSTHKTICEISLFRDLMQAIKNIYKHSAYVKEYHGTKHLVSYDYNVPSFNFSNAICELCDLLLIFEGKNEENQREIRYTFLQAKYDRGNLSNQKFKCSLRQHYLLSQYPSITGLRRFIIPSTILQNRITDSIGTFGIFIKDKNNKYDMVYSIANNIDLYPVTNADPIRKNYSYSHQVNFNPIVKTTNRYKEMVFCNTLDDFETAANKMLIGNPVGDDDKLFIQNIIAALKEDDPKHPILNDENEVVITLDDLKFNIVYIDLDQISSKEKQYYYDKA